ncbi:MAG: 30S ribosomal protein S4 [Candidatus ainarchaeum sp.]|nr:30S ribosomal protein S4 [Candidatus ainarchaeum sp.]
MGDPKKRKRQYSRPRKSFQKERIEKEKTLKEQYGLKNKKEFYRAESIIRAKRATARKLLALNLEIRLKREKELLESLKKIGILNQNPTLDDVLTLTAEALLERRLQTIVWRKGLANTTKQARQFITHGHISIDGKKVDRPSYLVNAEEEKSIKYYGKEMQIEMKKHLKIVQEKDKNKIKEEFNEIKEDTKKNEEERINDEKAKKDLKEKFNEIKE